LKDLDSSVVIKDYQSYIPYNSIPMINRPAFENGKPVKKAVPG